MSLFFFFSFFLLFINIIISDKPQNNDCDDSDNGTCNAPKSQYARKNGETIGQWLLRKQDTFYNLNTPYYNEYSQAIGIRVHNPNDETYDSYWYDPSRRQGIWKGTLHPQKHSATNSYVGHIFYYTKKGKPDEKVFELTVEKNVNDYIIPPNSEKEKNTEFYKHIKEKQEFYAKYFKETGRGWLTAYKRPPPILYMYIPQYIGQIFKVKTRETHWNCIPDKLNDKNQITDPDTEYVNECRNQGELEINIEVISLKPKVFVIEGLLSDAECEMIKQLATPKLHRSGVGQSSDANYADETRTSKTAWLGYNEHFLINTLYKRGADVLRIPENTLKANAEYMQTVYYEVGQEYKAHHDFADSGRHESRYITFLFYLNNQKHENAGGETMFPKGNNGNGIKVHPGKGNAILFYDLLEDGNGDDLTLHEAVKVTDGDKWLANFWVWDPKK